MNKIEILEKLIALANNNPNEHEANSAARRVCKLLVELKVNFKTRGASQPKPQPQSKQQDWSGFTDIFNDDFIKRAREAKAQEDARYAEDRRKAQEFYEKEAEEQVRRNRERYDRMKQEQYDRKRGKSEPWYEREREPREAKIPKDVYSAREWDSGIHIPNKHEYEFRPVTNEYVRVGQKKPRNCTQCGREYQTAYIGNIFVCYNCHWNNYNKQTKEAK